MAEDAPKGEQYEEEHVHSVYEQIASHFSSTRYKPWPIIERFLKDLLPGSVGLDVGCGNGKYLAVSKDIFIVGSDRSSNLTTIASGHQPHTALVADVLDLPHPEKSFDFAISIAVIHHLSTPERRIEAIKSILETLKPASHAQASQAQPGGKALLYVWALEQSTSRRGWSEGMEQDVMVPWVRKAAAAAKPADALRKKAPTCTSADGDGDASAPDVAGEDQTFHRYYHLYRQGELESDVLAAGGNVVGGGYEKDNWWVIAEPS